MSDVVGEGTVFDVELVTKDNVTRVFVRHGALFVTGRNEVTYRYPFLEFRSVWSTALGGVLRQVADRIDPAGA